MKVLLDGLQPAKALLKRSVFHKEYKTQHCFRWSSTLVDINIPVILN